MSVSCLTLLFYLSQCGALTWEILLVLVAVRLLYLEMGGFIRWLAVHSSRGFKQKAAKYFPSHKFRVVEEGRHSRMVRSVEVKEEEGDEEYGIQNNYYDCYGGDIMTNR